MNRDPALLLIALLVSACGGPGDPRESNIIPAPTTGFTLTEDLRVGDDEGADQPLFTYISDVEVADDGTMYVLDIRTPSVTALNADGGFIRHIGAAGDGPGEFRYPAGLLVDADSLAVLRVYGRVSVFDRTTGAYRTQFAFPPTTPFMINALLARSGDTFLVQANHGLGGNPDAEGSDEARILQVQTGADSVRVALTLPTTELLFEATDDGGPGALTIAPFARTPHCAETSGRVYCGWSDDLKFTVLTAEGDSVGQLEVAFDPLAINAADRAQYEERYAGTRFQPNLRFNETWPAFEDLIGDDEGRLWIKVRTARDEQVTTMWVVDPDAQSAISTTVDGNFTPLAVRNGKLYGTLVMESGLQLLVRYEIS